MSSTRSLTVGVIGGMGPDATVDFLAKLIDATPAEVDEDHIRVLVDHNPLVPSRQAALLGDGEDPGAAMAAMAQGLQVSGAEFLVMPCNTAHAFADAITQAVSIPFLSIIDVTVSACGDHQRVGLLATRGCLHSGVYDDALAAGGQSVLHLTEAELAVFTQLIAEIKAGRCGDDTAQEMQALAEALIARGADAIIAGCTEIPLVLKADQLAVPLISSTDLLAEATVAAAKSR